MAVETIRTLVPPPVDMPRGALWAATAAAWIWHGVRRIAGRAAGSLVRHLEPWGSDEPRTPQELLALARSVEHTQPSLAAELRFFASHRPDAE